MIAEMKKNQNLYDVARLLQWGRDQMIAEMQGLQAQAANAGALQWGRDQMIAEICSGVGYHLDDRGASMGPRSNDRGNRHPAGTRRVTYRASMGPRSNDRGNALPSAAVS